LSEHDHVGVVEHPVSVQDPGVVAKCPPAGIAADEHATAAQPACGEERIDGLRVAGGRSVGGTLCGAQAHARLRDRGRRRPLHRPIAKPAAATAQTTSRIRTTWPWIAGRSNWSYTSR